METSVILHCELCGKQGLARLDPTVTLNNLLCNNKVEGFVRRSIFKADYKTLCHRCNTEYVSLKNDQSKERGDFKRRFDE